MNRTTRRRLLPALLLAAALLVTLFALVAANGGVGVDSVLYAYVTTKAAGMTDDGVEYDANDILITNGAAWDIYFDGEEYGLTDAKHKITAIDKPYEYWWADANVDAPEVGPDDTYFSEEIYMVFDAAKVAIPEWAGMARGEDVVGFWRDEYYDAIANETYYNWVYFPAIDGSDIGLTTADERLDSLYFSPLYGPTGQAAGFTAQDECLAYMLVSTNGAYRVPSAYGFTFKGDGEDVLVFCVTAWEYNDGHTEGYWIDQFDGSESGAPKNSIIAIDYDDESDDGSFFFMTKAQFNAPDAVGGHSMLFYWDNDIELFEDPFHDFNGEYPKLNGTAAGLDLSYNFAPCTNVC